MESIFVVNFFCKVVVIVIMFVYVSGRLVNIMLIDFFWKSEFSVNFIMNKFLK